jgi:hypothetical protein
MTVVKG